MSCGGSGIRLTAKVFYYIHNIQKLGRDRELIQADQVWGLVGES